MSEVNGRGAATHPHLLIATAPSGWIEGVVRRLLAAPLLKAVGVPLFVAIFFVGYFWILHHPMSPTVAMPVTALDRAIGFHASAFPWYVTLWVYVSLPPLLVADRRELYAYGVAIGAMSGLALLLFYCFPTAVPHELLDARSGPGMSMLMSVDAAGNACPSMHVAAALFSAIWLHLQLRQLAAPVALRVANGLWCVAIVYSTMATKQHVAWDVAGGLALGALAARLSLLLPALKRYLPRGSR